MAGPLARTHSFASILNNSALPAFDNKIPFVRISFVHCSQYKYSIQAALNMRGPTSRNAYCPPPQSRQCVRRFAGPGPGGHRHLPDLRPRTKPTMQIPENARIYRVILIWPVRWEAQTQHTQARENAARLAETAPTPQTYRCFWPLRIAGSPYVA